MSNAGRKHNEFVRAHRLGPRVDSSCFQSAASANAAPGVKRGRRRSASTQPVASLCVLDRHRLIALAWNTTTWRLRAFGPAWSSSNWSAEGPCEAAPHDDPSQLNIVGALECRWGARTPHELHIRSTKPLRRSGTLNSPLRKSRFQSGGGSAMVTTSAASSPSMTAIRPKASMASVRMTKTIVLSASAASLGVP